MKQISPVAYQLQLPAHMNIHPVFHVDLLIPYKVTAEYSIPFKHPAPETINGQEEYEVNEILAKRRHGHKHQCQYIVSWRGYPRSDNSWVSKEDLHSSELLQEFHTTH